MCYSIAFRVFFKKIFGSMVILVLSLCQQSEKNMINLLTFAVTFKNKKQAINAHLIATLIDSLLIISAIKF